MLLAYCGVEVLVSLKEAPTLFAIVRFSWILGSKILRGI